jgi:multidrug efflux pump subunit AcrA (membrane-fusion protein)
MARPHAPALTQAPAVSPVAPPGLPPAVGDLSRLVDWRWYAAAGYLLILATFGVAGGWAAFARLDRAVISPGVIVAEGSRKSVQHLEGGIVQEVLVKEGQSVRAGEVLLRVDPLQSRASADLFRGQLDAALILEARLRAEQAAGARLDLPPEIAERRSEAAIARMIDDQASQLAERQASFQLQLSLTEAKITQLRTEMSGLAVEKTAVEQQVGLIQQELEGLRALREKDLIPLSRVLMMERERTRLSGVIGRSVAETAKAQNGINEAGMQAAQLRQKRQEALTAQLLETRQRIVELREKLVVAPDGQRPLPPGRDPGPQGLHHRPGHPLRRAPDGDRAHQRPAGGQRPVRAQRPGGRPGRHAGRDQVPGLPEPADADPPRHRDPGLARSPAR